MKKEIFKLILFLPLFLGFNLKAQDELTIAEAIERALGNNYDIKIIALNQDIAATQNSWGMAGMSPTFGLGLTNATNLTDNSNNPASFFPGLTLSDNLQFSFDMNWTIFSGFGIRINKERFDQLEQQTRGNAIIAIENTIYEVITTYYLAVAQDRKLIILQDLLDYSKEKLTYFQSKSDIGVGSSFDLVEFENQVLSDSTNLVLQDLNYRNSLRNLNLVMGESIETSYKLTDPLEVDIPKVSFGELREYMLSNNQSLQNQYINIQLKTLDEQQRKAAYYPVVTLGLGASTSVGYFRLFDDANPFSANTNQINYFGNLTARYTLFNGNQRSRNLQIAEIQTEIATLQKEDMELELTHQLKAIFELYQTQIKVEDMSLQRVAKTKQLWNYAQEKYDIGTINIFNLNDIKLGYQSAVLSYYDRLYDLIKTHYDLMRITGTISQEYKVPERVDGK